MSRSLRLCSGDSVLADHCRQTAMWSQGEINDRQALCDGRLMKAITPGAMNGGHSVLGFQIEGKQE